MDRLSSSRVVFLCILQQAGELLVAETSNFVVFRVDERQKCFDVEAIR